MITAATTSVWVRVDLPSMRAIVVTDEPIVSRPNQPVFQIAANFSRLDYYIIEKNASATYGITVRAATADERSAADAKVAANVALVAEKTKQQNVVTVRNAYCEAFNKRFIERAFATVGELEEAAMYSGTDTLMVDTIKPLAVSILNAKVEWRQTVCQPVITDVLAGNAVLVDDAYKKTMEDALDTFLTDRGFNVTIYAR